MFIRYAFSPDSRWLATGSDDKAVKIWGLHGNGCELIETLDAQVGRHADYVYSVCFSPDSRWLATGYSDKTVKIWITEQWVSKVKCTQTFVGRQEHDEAYESNGECMSE